MTEAQETAFWSTVAQISAVLLLTLVIEARRLGTRWSRKRYFKRRVRRWALAITYLTVLWGLLSTLTGALIRLQGKTDSIDATAAIWVLTYCAFMLIVIPTMDPLLSAVADILFRAFRPLLKRYVKHVKAKGDAAKAELRRTFRDREVRALTDYSTALVFASKVQRDADKNPGDPALRDAAMVAFDEAEERHKKLRTVQAANGYFDQAVVELLAKRGKDIDSAMKFDKYAAASCSSLPRLKRESPRQ